jgi:hypothetical protein
MLGVREAVLERVLPGKLRKSCLGRADASNPRRRRISTFGKDRSCRRGAARRGDFLEYDG